MRKACLEGRFQGGLIHICHHQDVPAPGVLNNGWNEPVCIIFKLRQYHYPPPFIIPLACLVKSTTKHNREGRRMEHVAPLSLWYNQNKFLGRYVKQKVF